MADANNQANFWVQYKKLPPELQDALFNEKTGEYITRICERSGESGMIDFIVDKIGDVFLGYLPPNKFLNLIKSQLDCNPANAQKIILEINNSLLYPLRESIGKLYGMEVAPAPAAPGASAAAVPAAKAVKTPLAETKFTPAPSAIPATMPARTAPVRPVSLPRIPSVQTPSQAPAENIAPSTPTLSASPSRLRRKVF